MSLALTRVSMGLASAAREYSGWARLTFQPFERGADRLERAKYHNAITSSRFGTPDAARLSDVCCFQAVVV